jgi:hypothetical protein
MAGIAKFRRRLPGLVFMGQAKKEEEMEDTVTLGAAELQGHDLQMTKK